MPTHCGGSAENHLLRDTAQPALSKLVITNLTKPDNNHQKIKRSLCLSEKAFLFQAKQIAGYCHTLSLSFFDYIGIAIIAISLIDAACKWMKLEATQYFPFPDTGRLHFFRINNACLNMFSDRHCWLAQTLSAEIPEFGRPCHCHKPYHHGHFL